MNMLDLRTLREQQNFGEGTTAIVAYAVQTIRL